MKRGSYVHISSPVSAKEKESDSLFFLCYIFPFIILPSSYTKTMFRHLPVTGIEEYSNSGRMRVNKGRERKDRTQSSCLSHQWERIRRSFAIRRVQLLSLSFSSRNSLEDLSMHLICFISTRELLV